MTQANRLILGYAFLALTTLRASADSGDLELLKAIARGDLAEVKRLATDTNLAVVPNLRYYALASPNADVVVFLRDNGGFKISDLQIAAIRGDENEILRLVEKLDKNSRVTALASGYIPLLPSSYSPLSLAVRNGHSRAAKVLIALGANVNEGGYYTDSPVAVAAERGDLDMVKLLLDAGVDLNFKSGGFTALMAACRGRQPKIAKLLLEAGADPKLEYHDSGHQALHIAATYGNAECVQLLVQHGADIHAAKYGNTALKYAELYKHDDVVRVLRQAEAK